jgi:hypothetical protein
MDLGLHRVVSIDVSTACLLADGPEYYRRLYITMEDGSELTMAFHPAASDKKGADQLKIHVWDGEFPKGGKEVKLMTQACGI